MISLATNKKIENLIHHNVMDSNNEQTLKIEIKKSTLQKLLDDQQVSVSDLRCLDCSTKNCIRQLCLQNCLK